MKTIYLVLYSNYAELRFIHRPFSSIDRAEQFCKDQGISPDDCIVEEELDNSDDPAIQIARR